MNTALTIAKALIDGVPKIFDLIKAGRDPGGIKLSEVISTDALEKLRGAKDRADDFITNG